jgi:hypothetical protein
MMRAASRMLIKGSWALFSVISIVSANIFAPSESVMVLPDEYSKAGANRANP